MSTSHNVLCPFCGKVLLEDESTIDMWTTGFYKMSMHLSCAKKRVEWKRAEDAETRAAWRKIQEDEA